MRRMVIEKLLRLLCKTVEFIENLVSQSLGLPANFLKELNGDKILPFKMLCYPRATSQQEEIGAWEHQDSSCITMVGQDNSGGYQVLKNGKWVDIKPTKGALVINIGDLVQVTLIRIPIIIYNFSESRISLRLYTLSSFQYLKEK